MNTIDKRLCFCVVTGGWAGREVKCLVEREYLKHCWGGGEIPLKGWHAADIVEKRKEHKELSVDEILRLILA